MSKSYSNLFLIDAIHISNDASVISLYKHRLQNYDDRKDAGICYEIDAMARKENEYYESIIKNSHYTDSLECFLYKLDEFLKWIEHIDNNLPIILWISIHGCEDIKEHRNFPRNKEDCLFLAARARIKESKKRSGTDDDFIRDVVFPDGEAYYIEEIFKPIIDKMPKSIVLLMSGCYQGLPKINRVFCNPRYGPDLIYSPIDWINSIALDKAVTSVISFIEENPDVPNFHTNNSHPTEDQIEVYKSKLSKLIDNIHITEMNTMGHHKKREFYRVWYRVDNSNIRKRHPENIPINEVMD